MYKKDFDELWNKTVNNVLFGIAGTDTRGKQKLKKYLQDSVWEHTWGNRKMVPPERQFLDDLKKNDPSKAAEIEKILSDIPVGNGFASALGGLVMIAGVVFLFVLPGIWKLLSLVVACMGIGIFASDALTYNSNPKKAAARILKEVQEKCDNILS